jgi:hypothetical protein
MWFCTECKFWYHFDCCDRESSKRSYSNLQDLASMPLLKGGPIGLTGTAPLVFSAAQVMQKISTEGCPSTCDWKGMLDEALGQSAEGFVKEQLEKAGELIGVDVKCPQCS